MPEYESWEESRGRIEDRFERIEETLKAIRDNSVWLIRLGVGALITLVGHMIVSFIQMSGMTK